MVKITGRKSVSDRLRRMSGPDLAQHVGQALFVAGQEIEIEAELSITRGSVSGKHHVQSRPGEPPNNDTGILAGNIETTEISPLRVEVSSNAPYAAALEFGTSKMAARPYMRPATQVKRERVLELVKLAIRRAKGRA